MKKIFEVGSCPKALGVVIFLLQRQMLYYKIFF